MAAVNAACFGALSGTSSQTADLVLSLGQPLLRTERTAQQLAVLPVRRGSGIDRLLFHLLLSRSSLGRSLPLLCFFAYFLHRALYSSPCPADKDNDDYDNGKNDKPRYEPHPPYRESRQNRYIGLTSLHVEGEVAAKGVVACFFPAAFAADIDLEPVGAAVGGEIAQRQRGF